MGKDVDKGTQYIEGRCMLNAVDIELSVNTHGVVCDLSLFNAISRTLSVGLLFLDRLKAGDPSLDRRLALASFLAEVLCISPFNSAARSNSCVLFVAGPPSWVDT